MKIANIYKQLRQNMKAMIAEEKLWNLIGLLRALFLTIGDNLPIPRRGLSTIYTIIIIIVIIAAGIAIVVLLVITPSGTNTTTITTPYPP